ncbi:FG-GAP-like repeat-containing protein [Paraflavitalea pollutisoli]|uniref:FG-GAP-like repeat-containing protein n=1 Tax=Paraflavitalea pollutisoli TaxID=3034143 RepID=UPI0023EDD7DD|nr:FG-GAP-like repeat-containing protein [Paraflavitalea sp. H1-2-19X]
MYLFAANKTCKGLFSFAICFMLSISYASAQLKQMYLDADEDNDIRKLSFYSPTEGYVAFARWIGYTTDGGKTYTKKSITLNNVNYGSFTNINLTFGFGIEGVKAFDKNTLIVYGDYGLVPAILASLDGGNSFKLVFHSQYDPMQLRTGIKDVIFPKNDNTGYAVDADRILKTTDKGMTWTVSASRPGYYFGRLEAVDNNNVLALGSGNNSNGLLKTSNGGTSWPAINLPRTGTANYAYFLDASTGWLSMYSESKYYFYKTTNGGQSWTQQNDVEATPFEGGLFRFTDVNTGYALVRPYQVYKTSNSGVTWEPLSRETPFTYLGYTHYDLQCYSATQVWAGGGHGFLEMTDNGGAPRAAAYFKIDTVGMYKAGEVKLLNFSRTGCQYQWLVNGSLVSTSYNATYTHDIVLSVDTVQLIVTAGGKSDTLARYPPFYDGGIAKATSYFPQSGSEGTMVTIYGSKFNTVSGVSFGGVKATAFTILSDTAMTAVIAAGNTGTITLKQFYGTIPVGGFTYYAPSTAEPPVIKAFQPVAGIVGTTVTITGSGFGASPSNNSVFFGSIAAKIQSASSGQLVCTVPVGASMGTIQVRNKDNGLLGETVHAFNVTFADSTANFTPNSFTEGLIIQKGSRYGRDLDAKDIDGDGKPDLIAQVSAGQGDSLAVFRNTTTGGRISFAPKVNVGYSFFSSVGRFAINDLDGDGLPDMVKTTNNREVYAYRNVSNPGKISFEKKYVLPAGDGTHDAIITDLDNDGKNDIAVTAYSDYCVNVMRNTSRPGTLSFGATQKFNAVQPVTGLAAGDLDGDGFNELVVYRNHDYLAAEMLLYRNTSSRGKISFADFVNISVPGMSFSATYITIVDFDIDGVPDIVVCNDKNICVFRNISTKGNLAFMPPVVMALDKSEPRSGVGEGGVLSNFSGNARPDVVPATRFHSRSIFISKNSSQPGTPRLDSLIYGPGAGSRAIYTPTVAAADFDGDGKPDLAASSYDDNEMIVYRNTVNVPVIVPMCTSREGGNTLVSDISGKIYQWQQHTASGFVNVVENAYLTGATTNSLKFVNHPLSWNGYQYRCIVDGRYSSTFVLRLNYTPSPGVFIIASDTTICLGKQVSFTGVDTSGYRRGYYLWQINGVDARSYDDEFLTTSLKDKDQVRAILYYSDVCQVPLQDTSKTITIHVNGDTAAVQINASGLTGCPGTPITFTATAKNTGALPVYNWMVNGASQGINQNVFTSNKLKKNDRVAVQMTSSATCAYPTIAESKEVTMALTDTSALSVRVSTYLTTVCPGSNVVFTAIGQNAGPAASYQWTVNGVPVGTSSSTFSSSTLRDKDVVQCVLTSPAPCRLQSQVSSAPLVITVSPIFSSDIRITGESFVVAGAKTILKVFSSYSSTTLPLQWQDSTGSHGWQDIPGATRDTIHYKPAANGDMIRCVGKLREGCMTISRPLTMVLGVPTATPDIPGAGAGYRWYPNPVTATLHVQDENRLDPVATMTVFNQLGTTMLVMNNAGRQATISMPVSTLPTGVYFVSLRRKSGKTNYWQFLKIP